MCREVSLSPKDDFSSSRKNRSSVGRDVKEFGIKKIRGVREAFYELL